MTDSDDEWEEIPSLLRREHLDCHTPVLSPLIDRYRLRARVEHARRVHGYHIVLIEPTKGNRG